MEIVVLIIGLIIGCLLCYFVLRPKIKITNKINEDTQEQNNQITAANVVLKTQQQELLNQTQQLVTRKAELMADIDASKLRRDELNKYIEDNRKQVDETNEIIYQKSFDLMQEKLSQAAEKESNKFQEAQRIAEEEYLKALEDIALETAAALASKREEVKIAEQQLATLRAKADAAIAAAKREEEMKRNPEDYCLQLDKSTKVDITRMLEFSETLNNPRALLMCIWTSFIRTPLRTLCDNIFGNQEVCGIYKLTINNQFYVGQSVHCKERMTEHFKKALGIDMPTTSKLYNYLNKHNIWDIQIELLEKCNPEELNYKEKFFIELTQADKSLNSNSGNR